MLPDPNGKRSICREIAAFFGDFILEDPGLVNVWPYPSALDGMNPELARTGYGGVARKL